MGEGQPHKGMMFVSKTRTTNVATKSGRAGDLKPLAGRLSASIFILLMVVFACAWAPTALAVGDASGGGYGDTAAEPVLADVPAASDTEPAADAAAAGDGSLQTAPATSPAEKDASAPSLPATEPATPQTAEMPAGGSAPETFEDAQEVLTGIAGEDYKLQLECGYGDPGTYWASWDDYELGLLSIDYLVTNTGTDLAPDVAVTAATATEGVVLWSPMPFLGDIPAGGSVIFTLIWEVPEGVTNFVTTLTLCTDCDEPFNPPDPPKPPEDPEDPVPPTITDTTADEPVVVRSGLRLPSTGFGMSGFMIAAALFIGAGALLVIFRPTPAKDRKIRK